MSVRRENLAIPVRRGELAATIVTAEDMDAAPELLFCIPGMTYTRSYYDLRFDGHSGYSFAEHFAALGHPVAMIDNLGTGASSRPPGEVDLADIAAASAEAADQLRERLGARRVIGIGHSMGGGVLVAQQANHASFDAIAALGFTTQKLAGIYEDHPDEDSLGPEERGLWAREHIPPKLWGAPWEALDPFFALDRAGFRDLFYAADVPADVIAADTLAATVAPRQAALDIITPNVGARFAAGVHGPVLLAYGDADLSPDPGGEAEAYTNADDVTLIVLDDSAHCHNLASTREVLWHGIAMWLGELG
jgi:pimeloyl-ACP methyl ester carboxylesterase